MLRLLIVEDEPVGGTTAEWFQLRGWDAEWAPNYVEAKEMLDKVLRGDHKIDALVIDRKLSAAGLEGDDLLRWSRQRREFDSVCMVMLTAYGSVLSATECLRLGADHYLTKPFPPLDLCNVLNQGILSRRARELRHSAVFGDATVPGSVTALRKLLYTLTGDPEMAVHFIDVRVSALGPGFGDPERSDGGMPLFVDVVMKSMRPLVALDAFDARAAGASRVDAEALIAVPVPGGSGRPIGVWAVESSKPGALQSYMANPLEEVGQVLGVAAELAEKRALLEERATNAVLSLREIRHRLSSPVQAIEWKIEELRERQLGPLEIDLLAAVARNVSIIRGLCYQLNDESGDIPIEKAIFEIGKFLLDYLEEFRSEAELKNIELACEGFPEGVFEVNADRRWLGYALQCLIRNAIDSIDVKRASMPADAKAFERRTAETIIVSLEISNRLPSEVAISVKDTGAGIPETDRERVFQPLFSTKTQRRSGFNGLGLYSVRRILIQHGGSASFKSVPGEGATFRLSFPAQ